MTCFAITGASGGGKSTLLGALAAKGYATVAEVGRQIVREQHATGGTVLPHTNPAAFAELLFHQSIAAYDAAPSTGAVFFDRSFIEPIAFLRQTGQPVPDAWLAALRSRPFANPVFVAPPWEAIYKTDAERTHGFGFAVKDHAANVAAYASFGYRLVELPRSTVENRVLCVERHLQAPI